MLVAVYGNLIYDQIVTISSSINYGGPNYADISYNIGGIGNFNRAVLKSASGVLFKHKLISCVGDDLAGNVMLSELSRFRTIEHHNNFMTIPGGKTSVSTNIVDRVTCQRTGFVDWGVCSKRVFWYPVDADWHHLMYIDRMSIDNLEQFSKSGIVSVDLCDSDNIENCFDKLKYVDYVICSSAKKDLNDIGIPYRKALVVHQPGFCSVNYRDNGLRFLPTSIVGGLNVLGAGDFFAAHCIASLINNSKVDIEWVHDNTLDLLRKQS